MYLNFPGLGEGVGLVERAFEADVFARLQAVKRKFDPENAFQINQNILLGWHMFDIGSRAKGSAPHKLKATGSNPVPATKSYNDIKEIEPNLNSRVLLFKIFVNALATFCESTCAAAFSSSFEQILWQRCAMIEFRTLPNDHPERHRLNTIDSQTSDMHH